MSSRQSRNRIALNTLINKSGNMGHPYSRCAQSSLECRRLLGSKKYSYYTRKGCSCDIYEVSNQEITKLSRESDRLDTEIRRFEEEEDAARARRKRF